MLYCKRNNKQFVGLVLYCKISVNTISALNKRNCIQSHCLGCSERNKKDQILSTDICSPTSLTKITSRKKIQCLLVSRKNISFYARKYTKVGELASECIHFQTNLCICVCRGRLYVRETSVT